MRRGLALSIAGGVMLLSAIAPAIRAEWPHPPAASPQAVSSADTAPRAFLETHCVSCHNQRIRTADLALDALDPSAPAADAAVWEKVLRKVRTRAMPPQTARQPEPRVAEAFVTWLERALDEAAAASPRPGRTPAVRRLNRAEYRNAIRDLLAIDAFPKEMDISLLLPPDDIGEGFDNMADALFVSPALMERYLGAARKISRLAIPDASLPPTIDTYQMSGQLPQDVHFDELPSGTRGGLLIRRTFPVDGRYTFTLQVARGGVYDPSTASERFEIELTLDGERVHLFTEERAPAAGGQRPGRRGTGSLQVQLPVTAGPHAIGAAFLARADAPLETLVVPYRRGRGTEAAALSSVTISGPDQVTGVGDTPSRRRIFVCRPASPDAGRVGPGAAGDRDESACAGRILSALARRAYRRPVTSGDLAPLLRFFDQGRAEGGFEPGIRRALERLLVSPEFLFRIEFAPAGAAPGSVHRVTDLQMASRLSFFLWSSIPDDELLDRAARGQLTNPGTLRAEVRRMLADGRAQAFVENFAGQWLYLRDLLIKRPDDRLFPDFDEGLRRAMARETELFFGAMIRENRSIFDLLGADFTFVNERLAQHYGIPGVYGSHFRRVALPAGSPRRGLLGQGSVLTVTSYANRTSPVNRGKFILESLLSMPPPPPPPDVPSLRDTSAEGRVFSMRTRMEQHRTSPSCASCHAQMDPLGFALENFDAIGRWRTRSEAHDTIDSTALLPDGTRVDGIAGLRDVLSSPPFDREFARTVIARLLTYALGRGVTAADEPFIRAILRDAAPQGYAFDAVMTGIVTSAPFSMRRAQTE